MDEEEFHRFMGFGGNDEILKALREAIENGGEPPENLFDVLALALSHIGSFEANHDITFEYRSALHALGHDALARALGRVTLRIGEHTIMAAFAVHKNYYLGDGLKSLFDQAMSAVLKAHGANLAAGPDGTWHVESWEDSDLPTGQSVDIDKAVTEFREELDTVLDDPMARWMKPKGKDDQ